MYQVVRLSGKYYALDVTNMDSDDQVERIESFTNSGEAVILIDDLDDLESLDISMDEIEIVEGE